MGMKENFLPTITEIFPSWFISILWYLNPQSYLTERNSWDDDYVKCQYIINYLSLTNDTTQKGRTRTRDSRESNRTATTYPQPTYRNEIENENEQRTIHSQYLNTPRSICKVTTKKSRQKKKWKVRLNFTMNDIVASKVYVLKYLSTGTSVHITSQLVTWERW